MRERAAPVPGLGEQSGMDPSDYRGDEKVVDLSGLLDANWYLERYPDVMAQQVDPLVHFCHFGWREGRLPNPYFDTGWYQLAHASDPLALGQNPLVHYVRFGEARDARPSPHFDTGWYREQHDLDADESPLRHYLLRCASGTVSPLPSFDAVAHVAANPDLVARGTDPYQHWLNGLAASAQSGHANPLSLATVLKLTGGDLETGVIPASITWEDLTRTLRLFLAHVPFDAEWYCTAYPDIAQAIDSGTLTTAREHFIEHGFFEGRLPGPPTES
jgi:hypothetical protein